MDLEIENDIELDFSEFTGLSSADVAKVIADTCQEKYESSHFVYCFSFDRNGETCWYVGETSNLRNRIATHSRDKEIESMRIIEGANSREEAREREREMSYEVAIRENSTNIYGGR